MCYNSYFFTPIITFYRVNPMEHLMHFTYNFCMTMQKIDFSEICRKIRLQLGHTQQEMADLFGVNIRTYQSWEAGEADPNGQVGFRLGQLEYENQLEDQLIDMRKQLINIINERLDSVAPENNKYK
jgi:DNA-binding XRE family transcriptional regulator